MAHAYTPGLQVTAETVVKKTRMLPLPGAVHVKLGNRVKADDIIATTDYPGDVATVNIVNQLGIEPAAIQEYMLKREGDRVEEGEPLAENKPLLKWFKTTIPSPVSGTVESISQITGQVLLRRPPKKIELLAYIDGLVTEILPEVGAEITAAALFIQGIIGIGGERTGLLRRAVENPGDVITPDRIRPEHKDMILFGGRLILADALKKALTVGVRAIIVGGFHAKDLKDWLGYDLGVAITGDEDVATSLIVTEGFGEIPMARRSFDLLLSREGERASVSGRTQIRAGVMRPEVIVPLDKDPASIVVHDHKESGLLLGATVRIIRVPYFGQLGKVVELPPQLEIVESEARVRVMKVQLDETGEIVTIPRANVEAIEE